MLVLFPQDKLRNISTRMASCRNFSGEMDRTNISVVGKTLLCTMPFPFTRERRRRIAVSFQETFEELLESPSTSLLLHMQGNASLHFFPKLSLNISSDIFLIRFECDVSLEP